MTKEILYICCSADCRDNEIASYLENTPCARVDSGNPHVIHAAGVTVRVITPGRITRLSHTDRFDHVYVCTSLSLPIGLVDLLRSRLRDPRTWPGYFPKIP